MIYLLNQIVIIENKQLVIKNTFKHSKIVPCLNKEIIVLLLYII